MKLTSTRRRVNRSTHGNVFLWVYYRNQKRLSGCLKLWWSPLTLASRQPHLSASFVNSRLVYRFGIGK